MRQRNIFDLFAYRALAGLVGLITASLAAGCGAPFLRTLTVSPGQATLAVGQATQFTVTATFSDGSKEDVTKSAAWFTNNKTIATVSGTGLVTSVGKGSAVIEASVSGLTGAASLAVSNAALTSISITPPAAPIAVGLTAQLKATGTYTDQSTADITAQVNWSAAQPNIATVNGAGLALANSTGSTQVTAALSGIQASTEVTVSPAVLSSISVQSKDAAVPLGLTEQFSATGTNSDGTTTDLTTTVTWTSSASGTATVSPTGLAATKSVGSAAITATLGGVSGMATLTVSPAALVSIAVSATQPNLPLGGSEQLAATGTYTDATTKDLTATVAWASSSPDVASLTSGGLVLGKSKGSAGVSASAGNVVGSTMLSVVPAALISIAITAGHTSLPLGNSEQLSATGTYTDGSTGDVTATATWSSSAPGILSVTGSGNLITKSVGSAGVSAAVSNIVGSTSVTVAPAALVSIAISSSNTNIAVGNTVQLSAIGTFTDASTQDLTGSANWTSSSPDVVSLRGAGVVAALAVGNAAVAATSAGISGQTSLTVSSPVLTSISLAPAAPTVALGSSLQLAITGTYSDGSTQDVTSQASWNIDTPTIASIAASGIATGLQVGTTGIEVTVNGIQTSDTLTVQPVLTVGWFDTSSGADSTIRITNPAITGQDLCAMIYVFDQDQQMSECCGCLVSQDGLMTLSLGKNLLANPLTGLASQAGTVMVVPSTTGTTGSCNASAVTPAGDLLGWITHLPAATSRQVSSAEVPFSNSALSDTLASSLQAQCSFVQQLGSGQGVCGCGGSQY